MRKCRYADKYKAIRPPTCGCDTCKRKWLEKQSDPDTALATQAAAAIVFAASPLNQMARVVHEENAKWWHDLKTGKKLKRNKAEMLCLIHSEISEAMEGERKDLMDDHLPHRRMAEVELADAIIRILDYAGAFGFDLDGAVREKRAYNQIRADHKPKARLAKGGKKF